MTTGVFSAPPQSDSLAFLQSASTTNSSLNVSIKLGLNGSDGMSTLLSVTHMAQLLSHRPALSQGKRFVPTGCFL